MSIGKGLVSCLTTVVCLSAIAAAAFAASSDSKTAPNSTSQAIPSATLNFTSKLAANQDTDSLCGTPILNALKKHKVGTGETLASIAKKHGISTATIMALNSEVRNGSVRVGQTLSISPVDGLSYQVSNDENYKTIARKFNLRADVLFERNGCQKSPKVVFIPGAVWKPNPAIAKLPQFIDPSGRFAAGQLPAVMFNSGGYPLPYAVSVTSNYGWRMHPITGEWTFHSGIDLGASLGTPVLAAKSGQVEYAGWSGGYGNLIELSHDSTGTRYAHLDTILVSAGQKVSRGQQIGTVGTTGRSTGPHLHFEILVPSHEGWVTVDPSGYINRIASAIFNHKG